jgi:hypothetical protein
MKRALLLSSLSLLSIALIVGMLTSGCETKPISSLKVTVTPASIGVYKDQSVEFTASGGFEYTWSLENETWGMLSTRTGDRTLYTSRYEPGSNGAVQVLMVSSTFEESSTNTATAKTGEAYIEHLSTPGAIPPDTSVYIEPAEVLLDINEQATFTASGGSGNFAWSLSQESWGTLSARTGDTTVYTSLHSASTNTTDVQLLTVTSADESFSAYIKHKADSSSQNGNDDPPPIP